MTDRPRPHGPMEDGKIEALADRIDGRCKSKTIRNLAVNSQPVPCGLCDVCQAAAVLRAVPALIDAADERYKALDDSQPEEWLSQSELERQVARRQIAEQAWRAAVAAIEEATHD